jgi:broad specificity phosphatase PhoE
MRRAHLSRGAAVCLVLAVACGRSQAAAAPAPAADSTTLAQPVESVVLEVENHNWSDIVVYVAHDGVFTRLTQVTAATNTSLPLPAHLVGSLGVVRLAVRRIGGTDSYASEPISLRTGSTLRLTVESRVATSSVAVWH